MLLSALDSVFLSSLVGAGFPRRQVVGAGVGVPRVFWVVRVGRTMTVFMPPCMFLSVAVVQWPGFGELQVALVCPALKPIP